jgi:5,10-methenyltetrahydrofolate synthetase
MPHSMDPITDKKSLRREMIARRDALSRGELARIAARLADRLAALPEYAAARSILSTMAIGSEWSTRPFLDRARADGKTVVLPRVTPPPRRLEIHAVEDIEHDLVPGVWDIPEPDPARCRKVDLADVDFALVPALAVDSAGYRLGYGAGYFDRLLAGRGARPFCVSALPPAFLVASLPHEAHDIPVDRVVSLAP